MTDKPPRRNVVSMPIGAVLGPMMAKIRELAADSAKVFFSPHAQEQMAKRGITDAEVIRGLKLGEISGLPWHEPEIGGRACKVVFRPRGSRAIGVVTVVLEIEELVLKTVEWEDGR
ncbi:MAG: DUF4258 domain-containing protein [Alphaproteobacteria bacterium]|nr:DUF4258 domain-containing protein [Alphaproteobacteria bacterium]